MIFLRNALAFINPRNAGGASPNLDASRSCRKRVLGNYAFRLAELPQTSTSREYRERTRLVPRLTLPQHSGRSRSVRSGIRVLCPTSQPHLYCLLASE